MAIKPPVLVPVLGLLRHAIGLPVEPGYHPTNTQVQCLWPDFADLRTFLKTLLILLKNHVFSKVEMLFAEN